MPVQDVDMSHEKATASPPKSGVCTPALAGCHSKVLSRTPSENQRTRLAVYKENQGRHPVGSGSSREKSTLLVHVLVFLSNLPRDCNAL